MDATVIYQRLQTNALSEDKGQNGKWNMKMKGQVRNGNHGHLAWRVARCYR